MSLPKWKASADAAVTDIASALTEPELGDALEHLYDAKVNLVEAIEALEAEDV